MPTRYVRTVSKHRRDSNPMARNTQHRFGAGGEPIRLEAVGPESVSGSLLVAYPTGVMI